MSASPQEPPVSETPRHEFEPDTNQDGCCAYVGSDLCLQPRDATIHQIGPSLHPYRNDAETNLCIACGCTLGMGAHIVEPLTGDLREPPWGGTWQEHEIYTHVGTMLSDVFGECPGGLEDKFNALQNRIKDALLAAHCATPSESGLREAAGSWTQDAPTEQDWYWHTFGPGEPIFPISVLIHGGGTRKCFVSAGQLGLSRAVECTEYGGYWMRMIKPAFIATGTAKENEG